ncbi:hypothetical protein Tco_0211346 [Tanacetum coccineum]
MWRGSIYKGVTRRGVFGVQVVVVAYKEVIEVVGRLLRGGSRIAIEHYYDIELWLSRMPVNSLGIGGFHNDNAFQESVLLTKDKKLYYTHRVEIFDSNGSSYGKNHLPSSGLKFGDTTSLSKALWIFNPDNLLVLPEADG